jgi:hypothetical protein
VSPVDPWASGPTIGVAISDHKRWIGHLGGPLGWAWMSGRCRSGIVSDPSCASVLSDPNAKVVSVENRNRLARFGGDYLAAQRDRRGAP